MRISLAETYQIALTEEEESAVRAALNEYISRKAREDRRKEIGPGGFPDKAFPQTRQKNCAGPYKRSNRKSTPDESHPRSSRCCERHAVPSKN
jgi:hypothetical protein